MKHTKKLLCMGISILMLLTMCVPALAENEIQFTQVYLVSGDEYSVNGIPVDTSVPGRICRWDSVSDSFVSLNIGMYEPIAVENFEDKTAGDTVATEAKNTWHSYSAAREGAVYAAQENAILPNQYLKVFDKAVTISNNAAESATYGAVYSFIDYKAGEEGSRETGLTGKISFDFKVRMPDGENLEYKANDGDKLRLRLITSSQEKNSSVYYTPVPYIEADISVEDGAYYYRTVEKDETGATKWYNKLKLADYTEQWISLRLIADTVTNTYDLYCGNEKMGPGGYATYYGNKTDKTEAQAVCDISAIQFCANNNAVAHLDDFVVSQFDTSKTPVYYNMEDEQIYSLEVGTEISELKIPATFVTEDGAVAMNGKTIGFLPYGQPESTDLVGQFTYDVQNYGTAFVTYDIYKMAYTVNEKFDDYTVAEAYTGITVESEGNNNILQFTNPVTNKLIFQGATIEDVVYEAGYKIKFDLWSDKDQSNNFTVQLMSGSIPVLNMKHVASKSTGKYNLQVSNTEIIKRDVMITDGQTWNDIRFKINETKNEAEVYLNDEYITTMSLASTEVNPRQWRIYDYESNAETNASSVYVDDLWMAKYAGVASVDNSDIAVTVVKGQEAKVYAATILTDGTASKLPVSMWGIDTSVCGEQSAEGWVDGYMDEYGNAVSVAVTVSVIPYPYSVSLEGTALTVTRLTDYAPNATVYGAVYDETCKLVSVEILAVLDEATIWTDNVATVTLTEEKDYSIFTWNDAIQPLAAAVQ